MKITKMAKLAGISIRTLHYYDEIGLLSPSRDEGNNRREYTGNDFLKLYQILNHKKMGLSLQQIKEMMDDPNYDSKAAFRQQIDSLEEEKLKIESQIKTMHQLLSFYETDNSPVLDNQYAALFSTTENAHDAVGQQFWGTEIAETAKQLIHSMPPELQKDISDTMQEKIMELSLLTDLEPSLPKVQKKIYEFHSFLNQTHGNLYTLENFARLGEFYTKSEVFRESLEDIKPGLSTFMTDAIGEYVKLQGKDSFR